MTNNSYNRPPLRWMQIVGGFYVLQFVIMVFLRAPIRSFRPAGTLTKAARPVSVVRILGVAVYPTHTLTWPNRGSNKVVPQPGEAGARPK